MTTNEVNAHLSPEVKSRVELLFSQQGSLDHLYDLIGESLGQAATGESKVERAKRFVNRRLDQLKGALCKDERIMKFMEDPTTITQVDIALVIADKLISEHFEGLDVGALAVLLARIGILKVCQSDKID